MDRTIGVAVVSVALVLTTGCVAPNGTTDNTGTGAIIGGLAGALAGGLAGGRHGGEGALIGAVSGIIAGGLIGHMIDREQKQRLQQQSPQTLQTIQHNDYVARQQSAPSQPQPSQPQPSQPQPSQPQPSQTQPQSTESQNLTFTPLTVDDIKALTAAGVKKEAITQEIEISKSKFSSQDIAAAQQANVDPSVVECMKSHTS
jgi:phage tail tape-measure protein